MQINLYYITTLLQNTLCSYTQIKRNYNVTYLYARLFMHVSRFCVDTPVFLAGCEVLFTIAFKDTTGDIIKINMMK